MSITIYSYVWPHYAVGKRRVPCPTRLAAFFAPEDAYYKESN
jgi:hypothetical protein